MRGCVCDRNGTKRETSGRRNEVSAILSVRQDTSFSCSIDRAISCINGPMNGGNRALPMLVSATCRTSLEGSASASMRNTCANSGASWPRRFTAMARGTARALVRRSQLTKRTSGERLGRLVAPDGGGDERLARAGGRMPWRPNRQPNEERRTAPKCGKSCRVCSRRTATRAALRAQARL